MFTISVGKLIRYEMQVHVVHINFWINSENVRSCSKIILASILSIHCLELKSDKSIEGLKAIFEEGLSSTNVGTAQDLEVVVLDRIQAMFVWSAHAENNVYEYRHSWYIDLLI